MARTVNPERQKKTRSALFQVAARAFLRDGYAVTGMKALAAEAGCTTGKLYSNYSGKEELLTELLQALYLGNEEAAVRFSNRRKDPFYGVMTFLALIYQGAANYPNLREIYQEGLEEAAGRELTVQKIAELLGGEPDGEELLRIRIAVRSIPAFLNEMKAKEQEENADVREDGGYGEEADSVAGGGQTDGKQSEAEAERFYIGTLARILGKEPEQADAYAAKVSGDAVSIRERAYDVLVKLLQGPKKKNVKKM